jgi:hypothetical protein
MGSDVLVATSSLVNPRLQPKFLGTSVSVPESTYPPWLLRFPVGRFFF